MPFDYVVLGIGFAFIASILLLIYFARKEIKEMENHKYKSTKEVKMMNKFKKSCVQ